MLSCRNIKPYLTSQVLFRQLTCSIWPGSSAATALTYPVHRLTGRYGLLPGLIRLVASTLIRAQQR